MRSPSGKEVAAFRQRTLPPKSEGCSVLRLARRMTASCRRRAESSASRRACRLLGLPAPGDNERIIIDGSIRGEISAPPQLENVPGAKAVYVRGRSKELRYYAALELNCMTIGRLTHALVVALAAVPRWSQNLSAVCRL